MNDRPPQEDCREAPRRAVLVLAEIGLVFAVFFIQGAWPAPDVNEPYYLSKAIHFWNTGGIPEDFFLDSADSHKVFYFTFGWLARWLSPVGLAWTGRLLTWGLLAWSWWRLSRAVVPHRWFAVLTAGLLVALTDRFHMAGEWLIGGVEAKGFAFVLVFLGLEALVRNRWNRTWLLLGAASALHVLVGGWAVVAAGFAWLGLGRDRASLASMWPALLGGLLLSLPGLIPSLWLTWGIDPGTVRDANQIYVFGRLAHHLVFTSFPPLFQLRFLALCLGAALLLWFAPRTVSSGGCPFQQPAVPWRPIARLGWFCGGAVAIAAIGVALSLFLRAAPALQASLLRFYWFRLSDIVVPATVALVSAACIASVLHSRPRVGKAVLTATVILAGLHLAIYAPVRLRPAVPRAFRGYDAYRLADYVAWRQACRWIADSGEISQDARFLTPIMCQTFKWYAGRSEVATLKDIPQDATSIVLWWNRLIDVHADDTDGPVPGWYRSLAEREPWRLRRLGAKYGADYLLTRPSPALPFDVVYENSRYVIYRMPEGSGP